MPWRDLPERYGPYTTAYNRFNRRSRGGIWKRIFDELASKSRDSLYLIDSTIVKAHRSASGAKGGKNQAIGISRGGRTTKIHAVVDGKGRPLNFIVTGGQVHDSQVVEDVLNTPRSPLVVTADKAYDSQTACQQIKDEGALPIIPNRRNAIKQTYCPKRFYRQRHKIENFFCRYQGLAAHRHPLRQTRSKFPCRRDPHRRTLLDQAVSPDPKTTLQRGPLTFRQYSYERDGAQRRLSLISPNVVSRGAIAACPRR